MPNLMSRITQFSRSSKGQSLIRQAQERLTGGGRPSSGRRGGGGRRRRR